MSMMMNRRQALKLISGTGIAIYLSPRLSVPAWAAASVNLSEISPINRTMEEIAPRIWFSDYPDKAHKILWDKAGFMTSLGAKAPKPEARVPIVVIGGGMSGLVSAYLLRKHKPVILEQAPRFGGNAKGQSWHGIDYSIGAAYFIAPEEDSDIEKFVKEIGVDSIWKIKSEEDPIALNGSIFTEFWNGAPAGTDTAAKEQILKLAAYFKKVNEGEEVTYPDIPIVDDSIREYINELDKETFKAHLERIAGGPLVSSVEAVIEQYCWSSFGASSKDVSAAAGLNFYASEFGDIAICPGGNSAVAERVLEKLAAELPATNFKTDSLVYDVKVVEDGVIVSYQDGGGNAHAIHAQSVVMACPKFVVGKVLADIEQERADAIRRLKYNSYLVANVCIDGGGKAPFYDLYMLGNGKINPAGLKEAADEKKVTDVIYANYVKAASGSTVLTLYRGLPYDGARTELLASDSYPRYRAEFEKQIKEQILPLLKIKEESIKDLRIARWGHPLPVAAPGLIAEGVVDTLRAPFKERVFFVEQDNWALPAFETAVTEAQIWAPEVEKSLEPKPVSTPTETPVATAEPTSTEEPVVETVAAE